MRKPLGYFVASLAVAILILLLFPIPLQPELGVRRHWAVDVSSSPVDPTAAGQILSFETEGGFALVTDTGVVFRRGTSPGGVAFGPDRLIVFSPDADQLVLQDARGDYAGTVGRAGLPVFAGDRLSVFSGQTSVMDTYDIDGQLLYTAALPGPVVSVAAGERLTVVGLLAGGIACIDSSGAFLWVDDMDTSRLAYGVDIDESSGLVAAVLGPGDGEIVIYEIAEDAIIARLRADMETSPGRPVAIALTPDGSTAIVDDAGARLIRLSDGSSNHVQIEFPIRTILTGSDSGLHSALAVAPERDPHLAFRFPAEVVFFDNDGNVPVRQRFPAATAALQDSHGRFYIQIDSMILSGEVSEG